MVQLTGMKWVVGLVALVASAPLHSSSTPANTDEAVAFVEIETTASAYTQCFNLGDSHVRSFNGARFDVSGQGEWIAAEGPSGSDNTPHWSVQTYQGNWRSCGASNPDVTAIKDVAVKCGSWMVLASSPFPVDACLGNFGYQPNTTIFTRFFVNGTDVNGKEFDGQDIYETLAAGKSFVFPDGSVTVLQASCKGGCRFDDERVGGNRCLGLSIKCAGTETLLHLEKSALWDGGSHFNVYVRVPRDNPNDKLRCGADVQNLQAGYCGCWEGNGEGSLHEMVREKFEACVGSKPQFYDPLDSRQCRKPFFMVSEKNSIFAKFSSITQNYPVQYSLNRNPNQVVPGNAPTPEAEQLATNRCKDALTRVLGLTPDWSKTFDPRLFAMQSYLADCISDTTNNLEWDANTAARLYCELVSLRIQDERRDVYCAYKLMDAKLEKVDPDAELGSLLKTARTVQHGAAIRKLNSEAMELALEVQSSLKNIGFWYLQGCDSIIADSDDLVQDCSNHKFVDTKALECTETPPIPNAIWDKKCSSRLDGDKCAAKCSTTSTAFPNGTQTPVGYTCRVLTTAGKTIVSWEPDTQFQCCKGGCEKHPTRILTGQCEAGQFTCKDCPVGQAAKDGKCVEIPCPANAVGYPKCECAFGYSGIVTWSASKGFWEGSCELAKCPENSIDPPRCACVVGTSGTPRWEATPQRWTGTCATCTNGFSNTTGQFQCHECTPCVANAEEISACSPTKDRVCGCKPGFEHIEGKCQACEVNDGKVITYKSTVGNSKCSECNVCGSNEITVACTPTTNTICQYPA